MLLALIVAISVAMPVRAGEGEVLHVGAATTLHLDGPGWMLDRSGSRKANLVAVQGNGASFVVRGLKMGQTKLVFRKGKKMFEAHIDVLQ